MKLYIRNHPFEVTQPWWDRFEASLGERSTNVKKFIEDRRAKLEAHGALLQWEEGLPYLKFDDEKDLSWFVLKWS